MDAQEYLEKKIKNCSKYALTDLDKRYLERHSVADFIYKKLTSKKFRKLAIDEESEECVKKAIRINMDKNEPIKFTYPFGGYKLWRMPTSPEVDWAEFLMIAYYCQYVSSILQVYEPGVEFVFSSDDLIIERMNNVPKEDTDSYFKSFTFLLKEFSKYFPKNMKMEIKQVSTLYEKEELEQELTGHFERLKKDYEGMDEQRKKTMLKTSELNINFKGREDLSNISREEKQEKINLGVIYHDTQCSLIKRKNFVRGEDKIVLFTTKISNAIALGTTKTSITKFWTGIGVLENNKNSFKDRILSPKQLEALQKNKVKIEKINLISLNNFKEIQIV